MRETIQKLGVLTAPMTANSILEREYKSESKSEFNSCAAHTPRIWIVSKEQGLVSINDQWSRFYYPASTA